MVDFFGNDSETHVKLDIKAIAITKHKYSFQELRLDTLEAVNINLIQKLASARSKSSTQEPTITKVSITAGNLALSYLNLLK